MATVTVQKILSSNNPPSSQILFFSTILTSNLESNIQHRSEQREVFSKRDVSSICHLYKILPYVMLLHNHHDKTEKQKQNRRETRKRKARRREEKKMLKSQRRQSSKIERKKEFQISVPFLFLLACPCPVLPMHPI
ncbi:hypothetical protein ACMFMF_003657 [Clarireedia jacksonii]